MTRGTLDFTLPLITLPEISDLSAIEQKYLSELAELRREAEGSTGQLVEAWDCMQAAQTMLMHPNSGSKHVEWYFSSRRVLEGYNNQGKPVMGAKRLMLVKNAFRPRPGGGYGYYSEDDCREILKGEL